MAGKKHQARREFLKKLGGSAVAATGLPAVLQAAGTVPFHILKRRSRVPANDRINVAGIGMGIMGFGNIDTALTQEGIEFIAAADAYRGHLKKIMEKYGDQVRTSMNYQEILDDPEVDAVVISTPDHWHSRIAIEAMRKGKAVYCEKPMVQKMEDGHEVVSVQRETKVPFQVGSQFASSIVMQKAKELYEAGEIGELNTVKARYDRYSALGAWQYSIPPDASPETCDWKMFQGGVTDLPFDPVRFFRWRNYQDYGTGMAGDLFVHLFTQLHTITGSQGPDRIYATGGLRYWEDGRDVPDVMLALFDYPETKSHPAFNLSMSVNFVDGSGGGSGLSLIGSGGEMVLDGGGITLKKRKLPKAPGYGQWDTYGTFPKETQEAFEKKYKQTYGEETVEMIPPDELTYKTPEGYDMREDHFANWFEVIRNGGETVEGPVFGLRAAAPALLANTSYFESKVIHWDPGAMKIVKG